jgi:hypothetical protein
MISAVLLKHLHLGEKHVAEGTAHIERQRRLVDELTADGHDTMEARRLLENFEDMQRLHVADLDRLRAEIAAAKP